MIKKYAWFSVGCVLTASASGPLDLVPLTQKAHIHSHHHEKISMVPPMRLDDSLPQHTSAQPAYAMFVPYHLQRIKKPKLMRFLQKEGYRLTRLHKDDMAWRIEFSDAKSKAGQSVYALEIEHAHGMRSEVVLKGKDNALVSLSHIQHLADALQSLDPKTLG